MGFRWMIAFHIVSPSPTFWFRRVFWKFVSVDVPEGWAGMYYVKSNSLMKSHGQVWIFSWKTIAKNCEKSMAWSNLDFLVQENRQKLRNIVSTTYYTKAYLNIHYNVWNATTQQYSFQKSSLMINWKRVLPWKG